MATKVLLAFHRKAGNWWCEISGPYNEKATLILGWQQGSTVLARTRQATIRLSNVSCQSTKETGLAWGKGRWSRFSYDRGMSLMLNQADREAARFQFVR
jgi:hypothetical protein